MRRSSYDQVILPQEKLRDNFSYPWIFVMSEREDIPDVVIQGSTALAI